MKATCYHMRDQTDRKVVGGSLGVGGNGPDLNKAAKDLTIREDIRIMPSGRLSFYRNDKPVHVYLSVNPGESERGQEILKAHRLEMARLHPIDTERRENEQQQLEDLADDLGISAAIEILKQAKGDEL